MSIEKTKDTLIPIIEEYISIIKKEFPNLVSIPKYQDLNDLVYITNTNTVSLFIRNNNFYFPLDAFYVLEKYKSIPEFGSNPNYQLSSAIINNNTFEDYIKSAILRGLTPLEYFKDSLLHETLHFCGSGGASSIREGINELETRLLAKKYNLHTTYCGYPKETKIAKELLDMFGREVIDKLAFHHYKGIPDEILNFIASLEDVMEKEFQEKYYKYNYPGINGPIEKARRYADIDYSRAYELLDKYKQNSYLEKKRHL